MKNKLILFVLFLSLAFPAVSQQPPLQGHWYFCSDSLYMEVEFGRETFKNRWGTEVFETEATYYYTIKGDSLTYSTLPFTHVNSDLYRQRALIHIVSDDHIELIQPQRVDKLYKLPEQQEIPIPQSKDQNFAMVVYDDFEIAFNQRLKAANCKNNP